MPEIQVELLHENAKLPFCATEDSAGLDLYSIDDVVIDPGDWKLVGTGIAIALDPWTAGFVCPRSGLANQCGITVLNAPGVIDADYRGEIKVMLINLGKESFSIQKGDRIAQMIVITIARSGLKIVDRLPGTFRGENGFGHTGIR